MKTILLVDDNKLVLDILSIQIKNYLEDIEILKAETFKEATKYILDKDITIHVAIIDIHLPDCEDGAVVKFATKKNIPTIVLTGIMNENIKKIISRYNILDYVLKGNKTSFKHAIYSANRILKNYDTNVLVVDDSISQLNRAVDMLKKIKLNITTAKDGVEAYNILINSNIKYSLILTDYNMPNMDGMELTLKIREKYDKDKLGIIVLSSNKKQEIPTEFILMGANDFINKPYSQIEVRTRVNSNLDILELFEKTRDMANKDFLTGAYNRRYFFDSGNVVFSKAKRAKKDLVVAMLDIDKFKNINDTYGHDVGDLAIEEMVRFLNKNLRSSDLMARFGGEEFCILLEDISIEDTQKLFEKIRLLCKNNIIHINDITLSYSVSIGICYGIEETLDEMIKKADDCLYYCKNNGRNQIAINKNKN